MGRHLRENAVAYVALFVALGGAGAWAAAEIGAGDIKRNAVRSKHIKRGQVKSADSDQTKIRRVAGMIMLAGATDQSREDPAVRIAAKRGDLLLAQARVEGRRVVGPKCSVSFEINGPDADNSSEAMVFEQTPGFVRRFMAAEIGPGTSSPTLAVPRGFPVVVPGVYRFNPQPVRRGEQHLRVPQPSAARVRAALSALRPTD